MGHQLYVCIMNIINTRPSTTSWPLDLKYLQRRLWSGFSCVPVHKDPSSSQLYVTTSQRSSCSRLCYADIEVYSEGLSLFFWFLDSLLATKTFEPMLGIRFYLFPVSDTMKTDEGQPWQPDQKIQGFPAENIVSDGYSCFKIQQFYNIFTLKYAKHLLMILITANRAGPMTVGLTTPMFWIQNFIAVVKPIIILWK